MPDETEIKTSTFADFIIIENPQLADPSDLGNYTHEHPVFAKELAKMIKFAGLTPQSFPLVADLFSGSGSVAEILVKMGWGEKKITCIDRERPVRPLVDSPFLFWRFDRLYLSILEGLKLPPEVEKHRGQFDLVFVVQTHIESHYMSVLGSFFLRPGGVLFSDFKDLKDQDKWEPFGKGTSFYRKK